MTTENLFILLLANTVVRVSVFTETKTESIAVRIAFIKQERLVVMTSKEFNNEKLYQTTMSIMKRLLEQGAITEKEYCRIDTIFLEKYQPVFGRLYSDISLTFKPN